MASGITMPPAGAVWLTVTVHPVPDHGPSVAVLHFSEVMLIVVADAAAGAVKPRAVDAERPFRVAVMVRV